MLRGFRTRTVLRIRDVRVLCAVYDLSRATSNKQLLSGCGKGRSRVHFQYAWLRLIPLALIWSSYHRIEEPAASLVLVLTSPKISQTRISMYCDVGMPDLVQSAAQNCFGLARLRAIECLSELNAATGDFVTERAGNACASTAFRERRVRGRAARTTALATGGA